MRNLLFGVTVLLACCALPGCRTQEERANDLPNGEKEDLPVVWGYQITGQDGNTVMDMNGVCLVFKGIDFRGRGTGTFTVGGPGGGGVGMSGIGKRQYTNSYESGVCRWTYAGYKFELRDRGTKLVFGKHVLNIAGKKKTLLVNPDGSLQELVPVPLPDIPADKVYVGALKVWSIGKQADAEYLLDKYAHKYHQDQRLAFFQAACVRSRFEIEQANPLLIKVAVMNPASAQGQCAQLVVRLDSKGTATYDFRSLRSLVRRNPDDLLLLWMLAVQCRNHNLNAEGVQYYARLLKMVGTGSSLVHQTYANLLDELGRHAEALPHRRMAVKLEPASWSYGGLASTLSALGRNDEALKASMKAMDFSP
jgi:tetratricopeptide (TPR) repeat protein